MRNVTIWALARPNDPSLRVLDEAGPGVRYVFGTAPADFAREAPSDAMLVCSMGRAVFEPVWALAPGTSWIHSRAAGLDSLLTANC